MTNYVNGIGSAETVEFTDGAAIVEITGSNSLKIEELPAGVDYTVVEAEADQDNFVTTSVGEAGMICTSEKIAAFTNTKSEGGLVVSKKVISSVTEDHSKPFTVKVTLDDKTIAGTYGDASFTDGEAALTLTDGEVKVITGLPDKMGYTVEETLEAEDGEIYTIAYKEKTGNIEKDKTKKALVTNTRKTTSLKLTKKVDSPLEEDTKAKYCFFLKLKSADGEVLNGTYGGYRFSSGEAMIWVAGGSSVETSQIPLGTTYESQRSSGRRCL